MDPDSDFDYLAPNIVAARDAIGKAVADYLRVIRPGDDPFPVAWVCAAEWTNPELEQTGRAARDVVSPSDQSISASAGLGVYLVNRFGT